MCAFIQVNMVNIFYLAAQWGLTFIQVLFKSISGLLHLIFYVFKVYDNFFKWSLKVNKSKLGLEIFT